MSVAAVGCCGSFVGAVVAELYNLRPSRRSGVRVATFERRRLASYLPPNERRRVWIATALVVAAAAASAVVHRAAPGRALAHAVVGAALLTTVELLQHHIVGRARPVAVPGLVAADDAIRQAAIRHGIGLPGFSLLMLVLASASGDLRLGVVGLLCIAAAIGYWRDAPDFSGRRHRRWRLPGRAVPLGAE